MEDKYLPKKLNKYGQESLQRWKMSPTKSKYLPFIVSPFVCMQLLQWQKDN